MKNLFLYAKNLAIKDESKTITMDHIIKAAENMNLGDGKIKDDILKYLNDYREENDKLEFDF